MLTIKELAKRLSISISMAYRLVSTGVIASYQFGACRRISEAHLQEYLQRAEVTQRPRLPKGNGRHF